MSATRNSASFPRAGLRRVFSGLGGPAIASCRTVGELSPTGRASCGSWLWRPHTTPRPRGPHTFLQARLAPAHERPHRNGGHIQEAPPFPFAGRPHGSASGSSPVFWPIRPPTPDARAQSVRESASAESDRRPAVAKYRAEASCWDSDATRAFHVYTVYIFAAVSTNPPKKRPLASRKSGRPATYSGPRNCGWGPVQ